MMYKILITDDNSDARQVIKFLIDKYGFDLEITEACNGKEAYSLLKRQHFHILFTDVKMPFMDGIELSTKARNIHPDIQIIFFSAYNDFDYIKKALSLRAVDYILKPVNPEEFQNTIAGVLERTAQLEQEKSQEEDTFNYIKDHLLYKAINGTSYNSLKKIYPGGDLDEVLNYSRLMIMQFNDPLFDEFSTQKSQNYIEDLKEVCPIPLDYLNLNPFQGLLLFKDKHSHDMNSFHELAKKIMNFLESKYKKKGYIAISPEIHNYDDLTTAFEESERYLEDRFFLSDTFIFSQSTLYGDDPQTQGHDTQLLQSIQRDIEGEDVLSLRKDIDTLFLRCKRNQNQSHIYIRFLCCTALQHLYDALPSNRKDEFTNKVASIYSIEKLEDIETLVAKVMEEVIEKMSLNQDSHSHAIAVVKKYIHDHYRENLNLTLLAEKVYLSPRYLSTLFIQETGCGLNKYIKNYRMEKAKKLLVTTNMKVSQICDDTGYSNVSYFCKSFKDNFGVTPDKYRDMHLNDRTTTP